MNRPDPQTEPQDDAQREALRRSEKDAAAEHPENFKDAQTAEKVVEILPIEPDSSAAIQGIDPEQT